MRDDLKTPVVIFFSFLNNLGRCVDAVALWCHVNDWFIFLFLYLIFLLNWFLIFRCPFLNFLRDLSLIFKLLVLCLSRFLILIAISVLIFFLWEGWMARYGALDCIPLFIVNLAEMESQSRTRSPVRGSMAWLEN